MSTVDTREFPGDVEIIRRHDGRPHSIYVVLSRMLDLSTKQSRTRELYLNLCEQRLRML